MNIRDDVRRTIRTGLLMIERGHIMRAPMKQVSPLMNRMLVQVRLGDDDLYRLSKWFYENRGRAQDNYRAWERAGCPLKADPYNRRRWSGAIEWMLHGGDAARRMLEYVK